MIIIFLIVDKNITHAITIITHAILEKCTASSQQALLIIFVIIFLYMYDLQLFLCV